MISPLQLSTYSGYLHGPPHVSYVILFSQGYASASAISTMINRSLISLNRSSQTPLKHRHDTHFGIQGSQALPIPTLTCTYSIGPCIHMTLLKLT